MDAARFRPYLPLAAILLGTALLQGLLLVRLPTISADGIIFIRVARDLAAAPLETMHAEDQHPGFPAMLLAATRLVQACGYEDDPGAWMAGGLIVSLIAGVLSVAVVWCFAREMFDTTIANLAAIGFAVLPVPRAGAVDAQSDTPHALFYLFAAWMASTGLASGNLWRLAAAGLASGLAFWIRPEGLEVALVATPFVVWQAFRAPWPWRKLALALAAVAGLAGFVATPYMLLAGKITSKQLLIFKEDPAPSYIERLAEAEETAEQVVAQVPAVHAPTPAPPHASAPTATAPVANQPAPTPPVAAPAPPVAAAPTPPPPPAPVPDDDPDYSPELVSSLIGLAFAAFINSICQGLKFVFIPFYLLGNVALYWRRPAGVQIAFQACLGVTHILILMAVYVFSGYIAHRHMIPLVGLAMPFAALGLYQTGAVVARWVHLPPRYLVVPTFVLCCVVVLPYTLRQLNREFVPVMEATAWVQSRLAPGSGIICNSPYVGFYGRTPVAELKPLSPTLGEALLKAPDARYDFVVLHVNAHDYRPEWIEQLAPYYQPIREIDDPHEYRRPKKVVIFQARNAAIRNAALPPRP
jgi:4-amino-4-deoxy-L-arabinose transferase-like glycosyltransferase